MKETTACVALGSNLGEPVATLHRAAGRMDGILPGVRLAACSRVWHTAPHELEAMEYPRPKCLRAFASRVEHIGEGGLDRSGQAAVNLQPALDQPVFGEKAFSEPSGDWQLRPTPGPPWYANMVVRLECGPAVTPEALFEALMSLEAALGRNRVLERRWGPRIIDIDLLTFGQETRNTSRLTLPHPRMLERPFVALPLHEVAPELVGEEILKRLSFSASGLISL